MLPGAGAGGWVVKSDCGGGAVGAGIVPAGSNPGVVEGVELEVLGLLGSD